MIRRSALTALALVLLGGATAPAFAGGLITPASEGSTNGGNHGICLAGTNHTTGARDGICIWIPTT